MLRRAWIMKTLATSVTMTHSQWVRCFICQLVSSTNAALLARAASSASV
jgi:hypothetical protein